MTTIGSVCTGILGLDLAAAHHYHATPLWACEADPSARTVIQREHPDLPIYPDLTRIDWAAVPPVDVLTAGYPCQPFSTAGLRKGTDDDRHLWPHIADAIRTLRPRRVVLENVAGHLSLGFGDVLGDLAEAGFDAEWVVCRASDVGAPHRRARLFVVASDADARGRVRGAASHEPAMGRGDRLPAVRGESLGEPAGSDGSATHTDELTAGRHPASGPQEPDAGQRHPHHGHGPTDGPRAATPANGGRLEGIEGPSTGWDTVRADLGGDADRRRMWGRYWPAIHRWESVLGRPAPHPLDGRRLNPDLVEWMMGYPAGWTAGLSHTQRLARLGNAVVPQQAAYALTLLDPAGIPQAVAA